MIGNDFVEKFIKKFVCIHLSRITVQKGFISPRVVVVVVDVVVMNCRLQRSVVQQYKCAFRS